MTQNEKMGRDNALRAIEAAGYNATTVILEDLERHFALVVSTTTLHALLASATSETINEIVQCELC